MYRKMSVYIVLLLLLTLTSRGYAVFVPSALSPGDTYHLIFTTSTPTTSDFGGIAAGSSFVQTLADASSLTAGVSWFAVLSDDSHDAASIISDASPIYSLADDLVVNSYNLLTFGAKNVAPFNVDETGNVVPGNLGAGTFVFTGSSNSGTNTGFNANNWTDTSGATLGRTDLASVFFANVGSSTTGGFPLVAISEELTVPVPEPSSLFLVGLGVAFLCGARRCKSA